jgi:peptide deformylase
MSRLTSKVTAKQLDMYTIKAQEERQMKEVPLKVLFNPVITPVDNTQVIMRESCCSMDGFSGPVPRALSVHVKGLNEDGGVVQWKSSGWEARILQHEVD